VTSRYAVLAQRLRADWQEARRAADKARHYLDGAARGGPDDQAFLEASALNLHGFYIGMEHIFEWLARELDGGLPQGATWHRDLLDQMTLDVPSRLARATCTGLAIEPAHVLRLTHLSHLPHHHRDPFDRILVAQAQVEGLPIVTADRLFERYPVTVLPAR
jgi:hypothetical protein